VILKVTGDSFLFFLHPPPSLLFLFPLFEAVSDVVELGRSYIKKLRTTDSFSNILELAFEIDTLMFSSAWFSCEKFARSLVVSKDQEREIESTACFFANSSSPEWKGLNFLYFFFIPYVSYCFCFQFPQADPCCNAALLSSQCCLPRGENVTIACLTEVDQPALKQECQSPECLESYLTELMVLSENSLTCSRFSR
jgi:hypothetical protein